jgi:hypothetical protein
MRRLLPCGATIVLAATASTPAIRIKGVKGSSASSSIRAAGKINAAMIV